MRNALRFKFGMHPTLRQLLLGTGQRELVEHTNNDSYWGDGGDGNGQNMLGKMLMQVRAEIAATGGTPPAAGMPPAFVPGTNPASAPPVGIAPAMGQPITGVAAAQACGGSSRAHSTAFAAPGIHGGAGGGEGGGGCSDGTGGGGGGGGAAVHTWDPPLNHTPIPFSAKWSSYQRTTLYDEPGDRWKFWDLLKRSQKSSLLGPEQPMQVPVELGTDPRFQGWRVRNSASPFKRTNRWLTPADALVELGLLERTIKTPPSSPLPLEGLPPGLYPSVP